MTFEAVRGMNVLGREDQEGLTCWVGGGEVLGFWLYVVVAEAFVTARGMSVLRRRDWEGLTRCGGGGEVEGSWMCAVERKRLGLGVQRSWKAVEGRHAPRVRSMGDGRVWVDNGVL